VKGLRPVSMQRRILIIDDHDDLRTALEAEFSALGHFVDTAASRTGALSDGPPASFDLVITDLDVKDDGDEHRKVFKLSAAGFAHREYDEEELKDLVATALTYKSRFVDTEQALLHLRELIEFEIPSTLGVMHEVIGYLTRRVEKMGVVAPEKSNLFVALDEAFVNAVKHGNKFDASKMVRMTADVSAREARFTIEDEGEGFDVNAIPDPRDPANLFKDSGRGVLFIYNIMDEVEYNARGNRLTMTKRAEDAGEGERG